MRLLVAAGFPVRPPTKDEIQAIDGGWDRLVGEAICFLRVGTLSMDDWAGMFPVERMALTEAAEVVLAERASVHGMAAQSTEAAMGVGARSDGGATLADSLLRRAVGAIAASGEDAPPAPVEPGP